LGAGLEARFETHSHTTVSDGKPTPEEAVRAARARGVDVLAVTDHNTFRGAELAARAARMLGGVSVVYGNEVRTTWGDVVVLCPSYPGPEAPRDPYELRDWAEERGCALVAVHPCNRLWHGVGGGRLRRHYRLFHAVEVWNAYNPVPFNLAAMLAARGLPLARVSGSDAHVASMIGVAPTIVEGGSDAESAVEAVLRGRVRPTYRLYGPRQLADNVLWSVERRLKRPGRRG
jgi:predicted metal-dependent phosphoesterase TrpH